MTAKPANRDPFFRRRLLKWYDAHQRQLPWRATKQRPANPYHVFVSEAMLQQTQVATVIPYFLRFVEQLPTLKALAEAEEQIVLRLWQGLGYYSRARNLRKAAEAIITEHGGEIPRSLDLLLALPGVGRYTAGAIASIAHDVRAPILDGNVARVLCRIDAVTEDPRSSEVRARLWSRAEEILPTKRFGDFNSALMELGATVCTPRKPQCLICPVREVCVAFSKGLQDQIPTPKKAKPTPLFHRRVFCIRRMIDGQAQYLIEQRPATGRWAGLWQFITAAVDDPNEPIEPPDGDKKLSKPRALGMVEHGLTHRRYQFKAYVCQTKSKRDASATRRWITLDQNAHATSCLAQFALSKPQLAIAELLRQHEQSG